MGAGAELADFLFVCLYNILNQNCCWYADEKIIWNLYETYHCIIIKIIAFSRFLIENLSGVPILYTFFSNIDQFENGQSIILLRHVIQHLPPPPQKQSNNSAIAPFCTNYTQKIILGEIPKPLSNHN